MNLDRILRIAKSLVAKGGPGSGPQGGGGYSDTGKAKSKAEYEYRDDPTNPQKRAEYNRACEAHAKNQPEYKSLAHARVAAAAIVAKAMVAKAGMRDGTISHWASGDHKKVDGKWVPVGNNAPAQDKQPSAPDKSAPKKPDYPAQESDKAHDYVTQKMPSDTDLSNLVDSAGRSYGIDPENAQDLADMVKQGKYKEAFDSFAGMEAADPKWYRAATKYVKALVKTHKEGTIAEPKKNTPQNGAPFSKSEKPAPQYLELKMDVEYQLDKMDNPSDTHDDFDDESIKETVNDFKGRLHKATTFQELEDLRSEWDSISSEWTN